MAKLSFAPGTPLEPQIVYGHRFPGQQQVFHIGSGTYRRALRPERGAGRQEHVGNLDVEVVVLETHACPARARLREAQLISEHQPLTNHHHINGPNKQVLRGFTKRGVRCGCGAEDCYGEEALNRGL